MDMQSIVEKFIYYEDLTHNKTENTLKSYKKDLLQFIEFINVIEKIDDFSKVKELSIRSFLMHLRQNKLTKRSVNRKLSALRTFFKFLKEKDYISENPSLFLGNAEFNPKLPVILEPNEIDKIREVIPDVKMNNFRDRLIIELLYSSGIRANELLLLNEKFIDINNRELKIISKNKQERLTFFSKTARHYLIKYIEAKQIRFGDKYKSDILFVNNSNERLSDRSLRRIIDRIIKRTEIEKEVSPHTFRHSFAVYMLRNGMNIHYLQEIMGHTSIESTKIYMDIDGKNEIFEDKSYLN